MKVFVLVNEAVRRRCAAYIVEEAADDDVVSVGSKKTREQEKLAHSVYKDFTRDALCDGRHLEFDDWKRKLKLDFWDETGNDPEYAPLWKGLAPTLTPVPGTRYVISTEIASAKFPRKLYQAYITFLHSRGDELGVSWSPTSLGREAATA
jgi:hypothetical protein